MTGRSRQILATADVEITPGSIPGKLRVTDGRAETGGRSLEALGAVELILDASGSMLQRLEGSRRIEIAKEALTGLIEDVVPEKTPFALRVFGHREADSCRTDLEIPLGPLSPASATAKIAGIQARNLASGTYIIRLDANGHAHSRSLTRVK